MHTVLRYDEKPHLLSRCFFATGRSCILHLLRKYEPDVVFIPELHPAGVIDPITHHKVRCEQYRIKEDFEVDLQDLHERMKISSTSRPLVIVIHYFGYWVQTWGAAALAHEYGGVLFEDCAHCLPTDDASICGDLRLYSYNKLFPVIDGAVMFSCTPRVDLTFSSGPSEMLDLQPEAVEAYSRHLSANRVIADMPTPGNPFEWDRLAAVDAVSKKSYDEYYQVISKDMEPRKCVSIEYLGQYDHDKESKRRLKHAKALMRRISNKHLFREDVPVFALPVRAFARDDTHAALLRKHGIHTTCLGKLWSEMPGRSIWEHNLLLPLRSALDDRQLDAVEELLG